MNTNGRRGLGTTGVVATEWTNRAITTASPAPSAVSACRRRAPTRDRIVRSASASVDDPGWSSSSSNSAVRRSSARTGSDASKTDEVTTSPSDRSANDSGSKKSGIRSVIAALWACVAEGGRRPEWAELRAPTAVPRPGAPASPGMRPAAGGPFRADGWGESCSSARCRSLRRAARTRDSAVLCELDPKPASCALGDLAVLLARPALRRAHVAGLSAHELPSDHEPLVTRQARRLRPEPRELLARDRNPLGIGELIRQLDLVLARAEPRGPLHRRGNRAATGDRPPAILNPSQKPLLERVRDMRASSERASAPRQNHQLEACLRVGVLQILRAKAVAMDPQQHPALRPRDSRHGLGWITCQSAPVPRLSWRSGRHIWMSRCATIRPPSQFGCTPAGTTR